MTPRVNAMQRANAENKKRLIAKNTQKERTSRSSHRKPYKLPCNSKMLYKMKNSDGKFQSASLSRSSDWRSLAPVLSA